MTPDTASVAIVLAGGPGLRSCGHDGASLDKVYLPLAGRRVVSWALAAMATTPGIGRLVLAVSPEDRDLAGEILDRELPDHPVEIIDGGHSRRESERNALRYLTADIRAGNIAAILIHEAIRPLVTTSLTGSVLDAAWAYGGAVPGLAVTDVVRVDPPGASFADAEQRGLFRAQTPQGFKADALLDACEAAYRAGFVGADTSAYVERFAHLRIQVVPGDPGNVEIRCPQDLFAAELILAAHGYSTE